MSYTRSYQNSVSDVKKLAMNYQNVEEQVRMEGQMEELKPNMMWAEDLCNQMQLTKADLQLTWRGERRGATPNAAVDRTQRGEGIETNGGGISRSVNRVHVANEICNIARDNISKNASETGLHTESNKEENHEHNQDRDHRQ